MALLDDTSELKETVHNADNEEGDIQESATKDTKDEKPKEVKSEGRKKRKRPAARDEVVERALNSAMTKVAKIQDKSDARFYE